MPFVFAGEVKISPPGRLPHLSGVMMPARFQPFQFRRKFRFKIGPARRLATDPFGMSRALDQALTQRIDRAENRPAFLRA